MSASSAAVQIGRKLEAIAGAPYVCDDPARLTPFPIDGVRPSAWVTPGSAEELAAVVRLANQHKLSVVPAGGFTQQSFGNKPEPIDIMVRTDRLNQMLHYDPGDLTIGVGAGMKVAEVQQTVSGDRLMFPFDVPRPQLATVGGSLATSSFGPMKHGFGGVREYCIGVTFVTGDGQIAKAGGRVVKNVAGYDLMKLMIGSHGTIGVLVSANFKLFPAPRRTRTFIADFESLDHALAFRDSVQNSPLSPICLELISPRAHAYIDPEGDECWTVAVRASGSDVVLQRYRRELGQGVTRELNGEDESIFWRVVQDFSETVRGQHQNAMTLWLHLPPASVSAALGTAEKVAVDHNFLFTCVGRAGVASLVLSLMPLAVDPPSVMQFANAVSALRGALPRDCAAIVARCPQEAKEYVSVWDTSMCDLESMRAIKTALDPNGILNCGRFIV